MIRCVLVFAALLASSCAVAQPKSGSEYQSAETRALQEDEFANPGMLWVERGKALWKAPDAAGGRACAACHGEAETLMRGVAAGYPAYDAKAGRVLDLEARINRCRVENSGAPALPYESDALLALTVYVAHQARGESLRVATPDAARDSLDRGRQLFATRMGQMNLACRHCHVDNAGKMLRGDKISEATPNGYPAYRLEWQKLTSLQRRLRACFIGVRAEPPAFGSQELVDLSFYLASRANGLKIETPAVRR